MTPLVPAEVDLRDFAFMPLDVVRLRDSDLVAVLSGDAFRAAVILWCASWHQVPCASLPDDDRMLARLAGFGRDMDGWANVRADALRGFLRCDDGRLYHPVIAEKANDAWEAKKAQRERTAAATAARLAKKSGLAQKGKKRDVERDVQIGDDDDVTRNVERDVERNVHQGTGIGIVREEGSSSSLRSEEVSHKSRARISRSEAFEKFYAAYPHKVGRDAARRAFDAAFERDKGLTLRKLLDGVARYNIGKPPDREWCHPSTWLNQGRWADEPAPADGVLPGILPFARGSPSPKRNPAFEAGDQIIAEIRALR